MPHKGTRNTSKWASIAARAACAFAGSEGVEDPAGVEFDLPLGLILGARRRQRGDQHALLERSQNQLQRRHPQGVDRNEMEQHVRLVRGEASRQRRRPG